MKPRKRGRQTRWRRSPAEPRDPFAVFLRGLGVGALVGAAIAGSRIWLAVRRLRRPPAG
jgi:hypothetical protein